MEWDDKTTVMMQLWDIAAQERFGPLTRVYFDGAVGAFVVFRPSVPGSLEEARLWKQEIDRKLGSINENENESVHDEEPFHFPCVLVVSIGPNDTSGDMSKSELDAYCAELGFIGWVEINIRENTGIDEAIKMLLAPIVEHHKKTHKPASTM